MMAKLKNVLVVACAAACFLGSGVAARATDWTAPDPSSVVTTAQTAFTLIGATSLAILGFFIVYRLVRRGVK